MEQGIKMRAMSVVKVVLLAGAVAAMSLSGASAKGMKQLPPGACAFQKVAIANNSFCSFACDPATNWCSQQLCANGTLTNRGELLEGVEARLGRLSNALDIRLVSAGTLGRSTRSPRA